MQKNIFYTSVFSFESQIKTKNSTQKYMYHEYYCSRTFCSVHFHRVLLTFVWSYWISSKKKKSCFQIFVWHQKHKYNKLLTCFPLFPGRPVGPLFPGVPGSPLGPISPCTTNLISVNENICLNKFWITKLKWLLVLTFCPSIPGNPIVPFGQRTAGYNNSNSALNVKYCWYSLHTLSPLSPVSPRSPWEPWRSRTQWVTIFHLLINNIF